MGLFVTVISLRGRNQLSMHHLPPKLSSEHTWGGKTTSGWLRCGCVKNYIYTYTDVFWCLVPTHPPTPRVFLVRGLSPSYLVVMETAAAGTASAWVVVR